MKNYKKSLLCILPMIAIISLNGCAKQIEKYTVSFDSRGGTPVESQIIEKGNKVVKPTNPTKDGAIFIDWFNHSSFEGNPYNFDTPVNEDFTLNAKYGYSYKFLNYDGSIFKEGILPEGELLNKPINPSIDYFTFDNWYVDSSKTIPFDFNVVPTSNLVLYSNFIPNKYKINFINSTNIVHDDPNEYTYGVGLESLDENAYDSTGVDKFYGWYFDEQLTEPFTHISAEEHRDIDLYAKRAQIYSITYLNWPEKVINMNPSSYTKYDSFTFSSEGISSIAGLLGATFKIHNQEVTGIDEGTTGNIEVEVCLIKNVTSVTFDPDGGKLLPLKPYIYIDRCDGSSPTKVYIPAIGSNQVINIYDQTFFNVGERRGFAFDGYYLEDTYDTLLHGETYNLECGSTIYAKWREVSKEQNHEIAPCHWYISDDMRYIKDPLTRRYYSYIPYFLKEIQLEYSLGAKGGYALSGKFIKDGSDPIDEEFYNGFAYMTNGEKTIVVEGTNELDLTLIYTNPEPSERVHLYYSIYLNVKSYVVCNIFATASSTNIVNENITYGDQIYMADPIKAGYTFVGWFDEDGNQYNFTNIEWKYEIEQLFVKAKFEEG